MRVVVAGLGLMGTAYAERLAEKGFQLLLWSHRRHAAEELAEKLNARIASDDDLRDADVVLVAGWDDEYLVDIARRASKGSSILVNLETVTPDASLEAASIVGRERYVEAPVAGGPAVARSGRLPVIVAYWSRGAWERAKPVIEALAATIIEAGEPPAAMIVKLAFNNLLFTIVAGFAESLGLVRAWRIEPDVFRKLLESTWMRVLVERYWERGLNPSQPHFRLRGAVKDLRYAIKAGLERHETLPVSYAALVEYEACGSRLGDSVDYTAVLSCRLSSREGRV